MLSKDKGFDALICHLKSKNVHAARHAAFSEIPVLMNLAERLKLLPAHFKANPANHPKTRKTLEPYIQTLFGRALWPDEMKQTIEGLVRAKVITLSENGAVTYTLARLGGFGGVLKKFAS